jgi:serine/threonine protein kinase
MPTASLLSASSFDKIKSIGAGTLGKSYLARHKTTQANVVIKFLKTAPDAPVFSRFMGQLSSISHPSLLSITGISLPDSKKNRPAAIFTDYLAKGSLHAIISSHTTLDIVTKTNILLGAAEAIRFLHRLGIYHESLTLTNVLLDSNLEPKISDFSLDTFRTDPIRPFPTFTTEMAPEVCDLFCFGVIAYSLFTGQLFDSDRLPPITSDIPEVYRQLISECWDTNLDQLPSFDDIVMQFIRGDYASVLTESELKLARCYQGRVVVPSFNTYSLIMTLNEIDELTESNTQLVSSLGNLQTEFTSLQTRLAEAKSRVASEPKKPQEDVRPQPKKALPFRDPINSKSPSPVPEAPAAPTSQTASPLSSFDSRPYPAAPRKHEASATESMQFPFHVQPFDGIFAHWTAEHRDNVAKLGLVGITGNSVEKSRDADLMELVNFQWTKCWTSSNSPNSWIQFDFGFRQVTVSMYTIKTYSSGKGYSHLKSWVLEGKGKTGNWVELDSRVDCADLNGRYKVQMFQVPVPVECQVLRIRQTGVNHHGDHYLILTNVEFFGDVT